MLKVFKICVCLSIMEIAFLFSLLLKIAFFSHIIYPAYSFPSLHVSQCFHIFPPIKIYSLSVTHQKRVEGNIAFRTVFLSLFLLLSLPLPLSSSFPLPLPVFLSLSPFVCVCMCRSVSVCVYVCMYVKCLAVDLCICSHLLLEEPLMRH